MLKIVRENFSEEQLYKIKSTDKTHTACKKNERIMCGGIEESRNRGIEEAKKRRSEEARK